MQEFDTLPEEVRREALEWTARARKTSAAEVERELVLAARDAVDRFRRAAALVERIISE